MSQEDKWLGYSEEVKDLFNKIGLLPFERVRVKWKQKELEGLVLPRPLYGDPNVIIIKLDNGYNIGIHIKNIEYIEKIPQIIKKSKLKLKEITKKKGLPKVLILGTGGTISSKVDYVTGAVYPSFSIQDLYDFIPELLNIADLDAKEILRIFSEDMKPRYWDLIATEVYNAFRDRDIEGIVIAHGTDTMGYTAAALSFALRNLPGPVVLVGAQRSPDRPSSDAALNLIGAVTTASKAPFGEVVVAMHGTIDDDIVLIHRGTKVRKMHTSRRDAFMSINSLPLAFYRNGYIYVLTNDYRRRSNTEDLKLLNGFDEKTFLLKFFPGLDPEIVDILIDRGYHGIVIEATGLGHVAEELIRPIKRAVEENIPVVITSQCLWGRVNLNVYRRGVQLIKAGAIPAEDMLPETAYVKLSWILARTREMAKIKKLMQSNLVGEISPRQLLEFYPSNPTAKILEKYIIEKY